MVKLFLQELKDRKVRKTLAIYVSTALTTIGILKLFAETYNLPKSIFPIVVTFFACGLGSAYAFGWYHGKEGTQRVQKREVVFNGIMFLAACIISYRVAGISASTTQVHLGKSIAVLPFKNMSDSKEDEYFSDGVMEDILTQLSKIEELNVISRTTSIKYKNSGKSIREISDELGVATILEGSVRRSGNQVRIVGQLINAKTDEHIWAETYDREMKDIFSIQSEVASKIAQALKATLSPNEKELIQKEATANLDAYGFYLRGRDYYYRLSKEDNELAIELFTKAIALDPGYALAFAGLADAYAQRYQRYGFGEQWVDSSIAFSQRAIILDPKIAEPYKSLGLSYYQKEWYSKAMQQNRMALALNPNFASVYSNMGELLDWTGHQEEAIMLFKKGIRLQPGRATDYIRLGGAYSGLGLDSLAIVQFKKAIELQHEVPAWYGNLAEVYAAQGNIAKARQILDSALASASDDPSLLLSAASIELFDHNFQKALELYRRCYAVAPDQFSLLAPLGFTLLKAGRTIEGEKVLALCVQANQKRLDDGSEEGYRWYDLARVAAIHGEIPKAIRLLREAVARGSGTDRQTERDPLMQNLQRSAEFKQIIEQVQINKAKIRARVLKQEREKV